MFLHPNDYENLCQLLNYRFQSEQLLQQAITRKSAIIEGKQELHIGHNERLEFFGDSVLRTVISDILLDLNPQWNESQLSNERDGLVAKQGVLLQFAEAINLAQFIMMGKGETANFQGSGRDKILSDVMEAIIGAIFNDSGKDYRLIKSMLIKRCDFQQQYNQSLIDAILEENVNRVGYLLKEGADPNTCGSATIFKYSIGEFVEDKNSREKKYIEKTWGEGPVTLFYGEFGAYDGVTALQLALVSKRVVPPIAKTPTKPSTGRNAYIKSGFIYSEPLKLQTNNPTMQDIFALIAPIDLGRRGNLCQNLELRPNQPGYQVLQQFFETGMSKNSKQALRLLLQHGADPNKKIGKGGTTLHTAAWIGDEEAIKLLLQYKADITITNGEGNTAVSQAADRNIAKLLMPPSANEAINSNSAKSNPNQSAFFKPESSDGRKNSTFTQASSRKIEDDFFIN